MNEPAPKDVRAAWLAWFVDAPAEETGEVVWAMVQHRRAQAESHEIEGESE